jgi:hypothetical protein
MPFHTPLSSRSSCLSLFLRVGFAYGKQGTAPDSRQSLAASWTNIVQPSNKLHLGSAKSARLLEVRELHAYLANSIGLVGVISSIRQFSRLLKEGKLHCLSLYSPESICYKEEIARERSRHGRLFLNDRCFDCLRLLRAPVKCCLHRAAGGC